MNRTGELIIKALQVLPDPDQLIEKLTDDRESLLPPFEIPGYRAINDEESRIMGERDLAMEFGISALRKISADGEAAKLTTEEQRGLEAIILVVGRPAILIRDGKFATPPIGWEMLEDARTEIEKTFKSVGRIEISGHPTMNWVGTGFLVADDVVITNRHVAQVFCRSGANGQWTFETWARSRIDYLEEYSTPRSAEFSLESVIYVFEYPGPDLALFKVSSNLSTGVHAPEPLNLASYVPDLDAGRYVYVVGYPAWDPYRNDPVDMQRIFGEIYGVKRLQPGEVQNIYEHQYLLTHDCSTLGGNSGSCVVDLDTNHVIGLHFSGRYREVNNAVALWTLFDNPHLRQAGVNFVSPNGTHGPKKPERYDAQIKILDVNLYEVQTPFDIESKKLEAEVRFQVAGPDSTELIAKRFPFHIKIHVFDLDSSTSSIYASEQFQPEENVFEYTSRLQFRFPSLGQYELRSVVNVDAMTPSGENVVATHQGPAFRVISS